MSCRVLGELLVSRFLLVRAVAPFTRCLLFRVDFRDGGIGASVSSNANTALRARDGPCFPFFLVCLVFLARALDRCASDRNRSALVAIAPWI